MESNTMIENEGESQVPSVTHDELVKWAKDVYGDNVGQYQILRAFVKETARRLNNFQDRLERIETLLEPIAGPANRGSIRLVEEEE